MQRGEATPDTQPCATVWCLQQQQVNQRDSSTKTEGHGGGKYHELPLPRIFPPNIGQKYPGHMEKTRFLVFKLHFSCRKVSSTKALSKSRAPKFCQRAYEKYFICIGPELWLLFSCSWPCGYNVFRFKGLIPNPYSKL
ncbi:hypothetical protein E5288_WYG019906 [Bos mutus]|uniref:Uncharacterized protein n=1 Tax=Bos mutus TaxID=72004 RepID=A0A6B0RUY9_9CETA|nr:hypothetical protein [Bos mutus]